MGPRCPASTLVLVLNLAPALATLAVAEHPRIVSIQPARTDSMLVCRLETADVPGREIVSTLHSGLASALDLQLDVLDAKDRAVAGRVLRLHLVYNLWEEIFTVAHDGATERLDDEEALRAWLGTTPWLPVAPLAALSSTTPLRLRAVLRLHTIAPSAREQMGAVVAGFDGQEVSMGLGRLIRFFYHEGQRDRGAESVHSRAFRLAELDHAQD